MNAIEIYNTLSDLIAKKASSARITSDELNQYFIPEGILFQQTYLERLASSLQNSGMMHNSIRFNESEERYNHIKQVLCDFDCDKVIANYKNWQALYDDLTKHGDLDNGPRKDTEEKRTNWGKYSKGLYAGSVFLATQNGKQIITELCIPPATEKELTQKIEKLKYIEKSIHGLGFALTCDWLKECGCTWLAKPDIHIKIVASAIAGKADGKLLSDTATLQFMFRLSSAIQEKYPDATVYKLDKMIWLICTGVFYLQKDKIGRDTILSLLRK